MTASCEPPCRMRALATTAGARIRKIRRAEIQRAGSDSRHRGFVPSKFAWAHGRARKEPETRRRFIWRLLTENLPLAY